MNLDTWAGEWSGFFFSELTFYNQLLRVRIWKHYHSFKNTGKIMESSVLPSEMSFLDENVESWLCRHTHIYSSWQSCEHICSPIPNSFLAFLEWICKGLRRNGKFSFHFFPLIFMCFNAIWDFLTRACGACKMRT